MQASSLKIITKLTNIFYILGFLATMVSVLICVLIATGQYNVSVFFFNHVGAEEYVELAFFGHQYSLSLQPHEVSLEVAEFPIALRVVYGLVLLLSTALVFYAISVFKIFISNINDKKYFDQDNIALLKRISKVIVVYWAVHFIKTLMGFYLGFKLGMTELCYNYNLHLSYLVIALIIWMLAHIFQNGTTMQEENQLTI